MKQYWKRLSRGAQLAIVFLLIVVISAVAWGLYISSQYEVTASVTFQDAPAALALDCTQAIVAEVTAGDGSITVPAAWNGDLSFSASGVNETTEMYARCNYVNPNSVPIRISVIAPDVGPCFDTSIIPSGPFDLPVGSGSTSGPQIWFRGNAETYTCAGTSADFVVEFSIVEN